MAGFEELIKPGVRSFETANSQLFLVTRKIPPTNPSLYWANIHAASLEEPNKAWISLLYRPEVLGEKRFWHDMQQSNPTSIAERLAIVALWYSSVSKRTELNNRLTSFALAAASGVVVQPRHNAAIDRVTETIHNQAAEFANSIDSHKNALGVLGKHLARVAEAISA